MAPNTRHGANNAKKLKFQEKLSSKGVTTDALLKKLKTLHQQLAALDQVEEGENVELSSLNTARTELISMSLLLHKDRGVKAYTACCLADILRLYAPTAPYTHRELRDIFQFFFRQLSSGLKGPEEPYFNEYFHLLESLANVKSVVLVCDLPSTEADELLHEIFKDLFTIVKRDISKKVELYMASILSALIDESNSLPSDVLEILMSQFVEKNAQADQPAYRLAVQVCNASADRLQRHVCQYFGDLLTSSMEEDQEEDVDNIRTTHELVKRLYHSCPAVLHSVIPILEAELKSDSSNHRLTATQTLGEMYADKNGPDLYRKYPSTWTAWSGRKLDEAVAVRLKCVDAVPSLLANLPEAREQLEELLRTKFLDPDEKVRAAACKVYSHLDYEAALHHVSEEQLKHVAERGLDKKASVRYQALNSVGRLYSLAYPEIDNNEPAAKKHFAWIPDHILNITPTSTEIRALVEQILFEYILPLPSISTSSSSKDKEIDEVAWTDRLLTTMIYLSPKNVDTLFSLSGLKQIRPSLYDYYLELCIKNNGGIIDQDEEVTVKKLNTSIKQLAGSFPDPVKAAEDFHTFAKLNENRLYKLLKTYMDPQTDLKTLVKSYAEFVKRVEQLSSGILPTMTIFLRRAGYSIINQSSIPTLLKRIEKGQDSSSSKAKHAAAQAEKILALVSKYAPALYKSRIGELSKAIADESKGALVEAALMALANVIKWDEKLSTTLDKKANERIMKFALGSDWRRAKFAARYLAFSKNKDLLCAEVIESIATAMEEDSADKKKKQPPSISVAHVAALVQLARFAPDAFEQKSDVIMTYLVKRVLMIPSPVNPDDPDPEEEWLENADVPDELRRKVLALKVCRNRCLAHATSEKALEIATPVLKLFATLLEHEGSLNMPVEEDPKFKSRLRLQAGVSLLHLSTLDLFATAMSPKFLHLACLIQDACFNVRQVFLSKLLLLLQSRRLPPRYNVIPFLTVLDPEPETKVMASQYVVNAKTRLSAAARLEYLESIFIRLLHLLAHHPDFGVSQEELMDMATYVQFYIDLVATADNVSLLYHLAQKGKTVRDPESHSRSQNFYVMCELAQYLVKARAQDKSWPLPSYPPDKVKLPGDILRALPSAEAANKIVKTVYLPAEAPEWLNERFKLGGAKERKEKKERERKERPPAKRKTAPTKSNGHAKRKKRRSSADDDDDEEEDVVDSDAGSDVDMADGTTSPSRRLPRKSDGQQTRAERLTARTQAKERLSLGKSSKTADGTPPDDDGEQEDG
ncbi:hypothetical protein CPC08DRAFT_763333 [Agrocybe pediades]|nr:hypothetical protein CPC08DRAFT_763333 [Agrocybe pediades]